MGTEKESTPFLEEANDLDVSQPQWHVREKRWCTIPNAVFILNILLLLTSITIYWGSRHLNHPGPFQTDIQDAWPAVQYEERIFTGALKVDPTTKDLYREKDAEQEFFGEPSILIEDAWDRLLHDEFIPMTEEEAAPFEPELTRLPWKGKFFFEPDMLHSLHCLNAIRGELSTYMYNSSALARTYSTSDLAHLEHCMDRLRQSIMCFGDLTPSPLYSWPGSSTALGRSAAHTCRKFEPIQEWLDKRRAANDAK